MSSYLCLQEGTVLRGQINGFPKIVLQLAEGTKRPCIHPKAFVPQLNSRFEDVDCPSERCHSKCDKANYENN